MRVTLCLVVVVVAATSGCEEDCNTVEPGYAGDASDEVWRVMIEARSLATEGDDAASVTDPTEGAELSQGDNAAFTWDSPLQTALVTPSSSSKTRRALAPGLLDLLSQAVFPRAHAHLPPVTSDVHLLEIDVPGRTCPVAGLTTNQTFVFDEASWEKITSDPGERTLRIMSAFLTENRVTEGPFLAAPVTFTVKE
ncbi:MAG: hypothetical protein Q8O67_33480 [Deltaproteobacteria bacterium]|nr:hypothetical protein [Deltaproteobacteria bacterium]